MLVAESDRAKAIRSRMLDIVLDVIARRPWVAPSTSTGTTSTICQQRNAIAHILGTLDEKIDLNHHRVASTTESPPPERRLCGESD